MGVLLTRALLFGVCIGAPDFWKLPYAKAGALRQINDVVQGIPFISSTRRKSGDFCELSKAHVSVPGLQGRIGLFPTHSKHNEGWHS